jgi:radical SAM protein with 4Fe4S-binding SPASM domain
MTEVAKDLKADSLTFHNLIFLDQAALSGQKPLDEELSCSSKSWEGFVIDPGIDPKELFNKITKIKEGSYKFSIDFYPNFGEDELQRYYCDLNYKPEGCKCLSPWVAAYIFPDGELRPCLNMSYSFGNMTQKPLAVLWNNQKAVTFRRALLKHRIFPVCVRCTELYRY